MTAKGAPEDTAMADTLPEEANQERKRTIPSSQGAKARELFGCTVRRPRFAYAQVEAITTNSDGSRAEDPPLDALQVHAYCSAVLRRFLGATGVFMSLDLLQIDGDMFWVRLAREDLSLFTAAVAAWSGVGMVTTDTTTTVLRLRAAGNWLGSLLGRSEEQALWAGS